jgi:hypothetical protein
MDRSKTFLESHEQASIILHKTEKEAEVLQEDHERHDKGLQDLKKREELLKELNEELTFTSIERKLLIESDEVDEEAGASRHEQEMKMVKRATAGITGEERFDRFKEDFFKGIGKLNRMQSIAESLIKD